MNKLPVVFNFIGDFLKEEQIYSRKKEEHYHYPRKVMTQWSFLDVAKCELHRTRLK